MKIEKHYRPELVVAKGKEPNPLLTDPYLDTKAKRIVSTNGFALVSLPVSVEKEERSRYLSCSLLKAARKLGEPDEPAEIEDQKIVQYGVLWPTAQERTFVDWKKAIPKFGRGVEGTVTFALNPTALSMIANAMGAGGGVCLTIEVSATEDAPSAVVITPLNKEAKELGLLMPMKADGAGVPILADGQVCPTCRRLLAAGAPCPEHGYPTEAAKKEQERAALKDQADAILKNAGSGELAKKELTGEAVARKKGGRRAQG